MRILVTGSRGYIGSILTPSLRAAGHEVAELDTDYYAAADFGDPPRPAAPAVLRDVRDVTPFDLEGLDAVVHLAALSNDPLGDLDRELTLRINLDGTLRLAAAARSAGVGRFILASSCSMYGAAGEGEEVGEDASVQPLTVYAESKARSEEGLHDLADASFSPVSMRNATVFGLSPRLRLDIVLNNLAAWAHTTGRIRLLSDGSSWRPLVHVQDVAATTLALLEAPRPLVHDQAFNVGSAEQNVRIRDLAVALRELTGCAVELSSEATADPRSYRVSFAKIERAFPGLRCQWNIDRGANELMDGYREAGLTWDAFEGGRYTRLAELRRLLDSAALTPELRWAERADGAGSE